MVSFIFSTRPQIAIPAIGRFEPKGNVAKQYEVYDENTGECMRALYVLDEEGIICWNYLSPVGINPGADGILDALDELDKSKK